jgi:pimeloyl-ACP methyl ester carboxylesterase
MSENIDQQRRAMLSATAKGIALSGLAAAGGAFVANAGAAPARTAGLDGLGALKRVQAGPLDVGYFDIGPRQGSPVLLLHGFPYDVHSYQEVAPMLASHGCRVVVPYLRGHGATRLRDVDEPRSGQQAAIGTDVIDLMDALEIPDAVLAGYDWGGRAACVVAALWPERCRGLVSVNGYLIQDIAGAARPAPARIEWGLWYQHYFQTERGRAGLAANRREIARILWRNNSPSWAFDDATFDRSASAFDNPDFVDVVIHSYRHRMGLADGVPRYSEVEARLAALPPIAVPATTLDGGADGVVPATDGRSAAARFVGHRRAHRVVEGAGHNLPQEAPMAFVVSVLKLVASSTSHQE